MGISQKRSLRSIVVPRHVHDRFIVHSMAAATGIAVVVRASGGGSWLNASLLYMGGFVGFHLVLAPFVMGWVYAKTRFEQFVRAIVEEELIRFDLRNYDRQLKRILPPDARIEGSADRQPPSERGDDGDFKSSSMRTKSPG